MEVGSMGHVGEAGLKRWSRRSLLGAALVAGALAVGVSAAGAGSKRTSGLPAVIHIPVVMSLSGAAALPGTQLVEGMKFAVSQINSQKFLGKSKIVLDINDDQTDTNRAFRLVTDVVNSKPPAFLGPGVSALALTTAPIAVQGKISYIATEAVNSGLRPLVQRGGYIFRMTPPEFNYQEIMVKYLATHKIKDASILYVQEGAAQAEWAKSTLPPLFKKYKMKINDTIAFPQTQTDFTALATRLAQENPDAIGIASFSSQNPTLFNQIRQAGYKGQLFGEGSFGGNSLVGAGTSANGAIWASDYAPFMTAPTSVAFTKAWRKAHGNADPLNFNAEGFDGAWFLAHALKRANSVDPAVVNKALDALTQNRYYGAIGKITFKRTHDAFSEGVLLRWQDGKPTRAAG
jgi:branched-chain amino acid transport system substrate-binding protein